MWNDDDRKWLYEQMRKNGVNTGSYDDFTKSLDNKEDRDWYYQKSRSLGLNVGSADDFASMMVQPVQKPAPAPAQPVVKQTTGQVNPTVNTSTQPKQDEQPQKQGGWQPTWQEKMGMQMQLDETMRQVKQSQQDFNTRMENIRKGNTLGKTSEVKFNPESGKMERRYYTTHGDEVTTPLEQSRLNLKYRDEWEATTPEGRKHREKRIENDFERRVGASLDKYDPDNAAAMVWQQAEDKSNEEFGRYLDERSKPSWSNFLRGAADGTSVTGGLGADNVDTGIKAFATHLKYHDLQRMADDAWNMLGKEKQQSIIEDMYGALKNRYPQATEQQLQQAATEMAREQSDRRMYELAVAKNAPKDAAEYFIRKVAAGNAMGTLMQAAARAQAGTTGDWEAREDAEQRFEKQGHKVAGIAGTVTGFALDPLTWASAGAGGAAVKGTTWLGGKMIGEAAMRKFGTTLGGRMLGGAIGGAVNFGTYEAGSEALDQMKWGGYIDEETGERKDGFSFGNVAGRAGHGLMMGAVTGVIAPYLGNVSDKLVRATESTVGKMGIRAGELGVGTVAEGTIFAVPEIINTYGQYGDLINSLSDETSPNYIADEQERAAKIEELRNSRGDALMDVWTDNMAMIAGFKAQHLLKSAPRVIYDLARSKNGKAGFETRLRSILDGRGDLALTEDEKKELERRGYGDLKDLTEEYSRYAEAKEEYDKARPTTTDASRMIEGGDGQAELPYNRFVELMTDNSVSEAARAKMYYYLTGHGLPMSTVMGSSILEDKDADGNVTGYTVQSFGANGVITSRSFGDKKRADVEVNRINRQAELNGFDVGERYYDWQGDNKRMYEACETVAEETGAPANLLFDLMKRKTEAMNEVELEWAEKILNAYNGLGDKYGSSEVRTAINEEFGVDVDKAIRKERNRRSEQEQKAVDEYASRLFADVKRKQEEAAERGEAPVDPDAPTSNSQIAALLGIDDGEQGDPVSAAFNRGHEADAQERQDIAIELTDPNNAEAQEAWNGVVQRINEDAAYMVAQQREQTKQMQHTDGSLRPAILKEKDSEGNDQQVYIVDGNVQMMPDGSVVDKASSDNIVVIYNPATGERKQIDPSADTGISSLGEVTTAEQREADIERSRQEYVQAQIDEAQGTVRFVPGQQLVLPTGEEAVVVATDADGENITVALGDGTQATVQRSELQRIRDEKASADYRQRHGITEEPAAQQPEASAPAQPQTDGRVAGAPADYTADMELTIRDEDGSEKPAMVMGRVRYENGSFVPDANGNIIEYFMDGEVKHDHEDKLVDKVVSHVAPQQPEAAPVQEASAETPATVETTPPPVEQQAEVAPQPVQEPVQTVEPQPTQPAEAPAQPIEQPTAEPMPVGEDGEEDWQATTPERAHAYIFNEAGLSRSEGNEFIAAQTQAAQSALVKAKSAQMPRVGTSIKKYNEAKAKRQEKIDEAQRVLDYWQQVRNIQNDIQRVENERRAAEDAVRHDEAVAEAQAEYEARKQAEAERKAVGNENPMPAITEKWNNATKVDGHRDEIMLPDGTPLKGHYVLHESGASSPSHNPETWQKTDGFPMDANDNSVNDRDYERDHDAQEHTQSIARQYDQRALQSVPVVSNDGVVLSGNGRTMAGELAARDNTDGAYVNYLKEYAPKFGFTPEQVEAMQHPRVSFVPDEAMPYTAETFAKFNQQEMKSQNKTEQAVKLGKTVNDDSFKGIVRTINGYDTLGDFYNDAEASLGAVYDLHNAGVVPQAQLAEMVDGVRGQEKLSAVGREFLENMLIGKAFEGDPEVVRMLTAEPAMRQTVITALGEIVDNIALGGDWSLQGELADAVKLCFDARQGGAKYGEIVSTYARQGVLFADPDELQTVADFNNATMLMLADVLNDKRVTLLKTTLQLYNNNARQSAVGQADLFAGGIQSREDILRDVITFINENYGKRKEIEAARAEAVERRKAESVQQDGTPPAVSTDGEATAEPSAEPAPVEAEPVEATEPVEAEPNAVQTALAAAEQETNTEPTEAQKEAGNYKKGHVKIDGYDVTIENPKGSVRRGTDASGKQWEQEMQNTYGYIRGTEGVDGDHIDVFFSEDPSQGDVFVVDQVNKDGSFDEHKVMYGFPDIESARKAYLSNYEDGWQGLGAITPVSKEEFKKWIDSSHRKTKPFAEYSSVKPLGDTQLGEQREQPKEIVPDVTQEGPAQPGAGAQGDRGGRGVDAQGNPVDGAGRLVVEKVGSVDELTDGDFTSPTRTVQLPELPENVDRAIGAGGKRVIIKKNIFEKNARSHQFTPAESRNILHEALYNTDLAGQTQPSRRPNHWVVIKIDEKSPITVLEVSNNKDNVEVVGWYRLDGRNLERLKRQAEREDGELLILTPKGAAAGLSTLPSSQSSGGKGSEKSGGMQEHGKPEVEAVKEKIAEIERLDKLLEPLLGEDTEEEKSIEGKHREATSELERLLMKLSLEQLEELGETKGEWKGTSLDNWWVRGVLSGVSDYKEGQARIQAELDKRAEASKQIEPGKPQKKVAPMDFSYVDNGEERGTSNAVYHDGGFVVGTNGHIIYARREDYPAELEGKRTNKNGETTGGRLPKTWREILPTGEQTEPLEASIDGLHSFVAGVRKADRSKDALVAIRLPNGRVVMYNAKGLDLFLRAAKASNAEVRLTGDDAGYKREGLWFHTDDAAGMIMPSIIAADRVYAYIDNTWVYDARGGGGAVLEDKAGVEGAERASAEERLKVEALAEKLNGMGIATSTDWEQGQQVLDMANGALLNKKNKKAPATVSVSSEEEHQPTVVASADGANVLNDLDKTKEKYENQANRSNTFIGDVAKALGIPEKKIKNKSSQYKTFEAKNGKIVTIRVSNHNATVSNFDNHGEKNGISIVVSPKKSEGINNDGTAHVVEYYYDAIKLRKAEGKPLAEIVRSIKQALYSGEFKDTTGLAVRQEVNIDGQHGSGVQFFRTADGKEAYGFTVGGKIYIDPRIATAATPVHEYAHLWSLALERANPEAWEHLKEQLMHDKDLLALVRSKYPDIKGENELMHEVFAHYGGRRGKERIDAECEKEQARAGGVLNKARVVAAFERLRQLVTKFWTMARDLFAGDNARLKEKSADDFADMMVADLLGGFDPRKVKGKGKNDGGASEVNDTQQYRDKVYAQAVKSGDTEAALRMLEEKARENGYLPADYQGSDSWSAPMAEVEEKDFDNLGALQEALDDYGAEANIYGIINGVQGHEESYYFNPARAGFGGQAASETAQVLRRLRAEHAAPDTKIKVYRVVPNEVQGDSLMQGDWVALSRTYCEELGKNKYGEGRYRIIESDVPIKYLWQGSEDMREFGYDDGKKDVEKNVKNNRKLLEITYDEQGRLIPLSERFNPKSPDIRYQFAGEKGAAAADKAEEATWRLDNLGVARRMETAGKDAKAIKLATGWERGGDGKWRYEIPDFKAVDPYGNIEYLRRHPEYRRLFELNGKQNAEDFMGIAMSEADKAELEELARRLEVPTSGIFKDPYRLMLEDYVDAPELLKAYPQLRYLRVVVGDMKGQVKGTLGYYRNSPAWASTDPAIVISRDVMDAARHGNTWQLEEVLAHEVQHAIQQIEGFAPGVNPADVRRSVEAIIDKNSEAAENTRMKYRKWAFIKKAQVNLNTYERLIESGNPELVKRAVDCYWDAMDELGNNEDSRLAYEFPEGMTAEEIAKSGYHVKEARAELERLAKQALDDIPEEGKKKLRLVDKLKQALEEKDDLGLYASAAGEVEARNASRRMRMSAEERRESLAAETEDVAREDQIFLEQGLGGYAAGMGDGGGTFGERQRKAVASKGTVLPGLNSAEVAVVEVPRHDFTGTGKQAIDKAKAWAEQHLVGLHTAHRIDGNTYEYNIDNDAVGKFLSSSSTLNSDNLGVHLAVLKKLPEVIDNSIEAEEHPDYKKVSGERRAENGVGDNNLLVHRMYGAVKIDGKLYRVKTTMHEHLSKGNAPHDYRVTKIELLISGSPTSNALSNSNGSHNLSMVTAAKLLEGVEKSYDKGKKNLAESAKADAVADGDTRGYTTAEGEDNAVYRIREDAPPAKTGIGYKAFVLKDGKLYPPMVANPGGEATPVGMWLDADAAPVAGVTKTGRQQVKSGGKGTQGGSGRLAYRPGWHLGTIPYALQFNRVNPETGRRELFPANFVWAEVEYAADKDYQDEAMSYGMNPSGKFQHSLAGLPRVPENGSYMYRTNPDPRTDPWIITGAMKVKRVLTPSEVDDIVRKAGREPQPRQEGAVRDEQINKLNAEIEHTTEQDATLKRKEAEQLAAKLNTAVHVVEDVEEITHSNPEVQERRRRAKGWYDTRTGEVVVVLPNNRDAEDVAATVMHETVAHKGLREMIGEENYDEFLDQVHDHLTDELKKEVDERASRAFLHDVEDNGARAKSREEHQRRETDELLGRLAEKGFEDYDAGERTVWRRIKEAVQRVMDKFLGSLKLPSWFRLGDNELRYMLWRSKERLEQGREHPIDVARDVVKREELKLDDEAVYSFSRTRAEFDARQQKAVRDKGTVAPKLAQREVQIVHADNSTGKLHPFDTTTGATDLKKQVRDYAKAHGDEMLGEVDFENGNINVSLSTLKEMADPKAIRKSEANGVSKDVHLAAILKVKDIIKNSMDAEVHPDYKKDETSERNINNINPTVLVHRLYGAVEIGGQVYRVKTTVKESQSSDTRSAYAYEMQEIELMAGQTRTHAATSRNSINSISGAKLLKGVEKAHDKGKKLLDESAKADNDTALYRDPGESGGTVPRREEIDWDGAAGKEELAQHLAQIPTRVGIKARCVTVAIGDEAEMKRLRGVVEDELMEAIEKRFHNPLVLGASDPRTGMVIVFTNRQGTRREAESTWWHERSHIAWAALEAPDKEELGRAALEWLKDNDPKHYDLITKHYPEKQWAEEAAVRLVQHIVDEHGAEEMLRSDFDGNEKVAKLASAIRNIIKNGTEEKNDIRLRQSSQAKIQSSGDRGVGSVRTGAAAGGVSPAATGGAEAVGSTSKETAGTGEAGGAQEEGPGRIRLEIGPETEDMSQGLGSAADLRDIWNDWSMGLDERITLAQLRLAANHQGDKTLRGDAMRAIGGNLTKLRQAMSLQRKFDRTTVKRVADLARVLINGGYLSGLSGQEVKRLLAAVKNAAGKENIEGSVQKVMDIMVDNQLKNAEATLHQLEAIKGSKVDARGVEVQGQLDAAGQHIMKVFKKARSWEKTDIEEAADEAQQRMGSEAAAVAEEAALEYAGLMLAHEYAEEIKDSKTEEQKLRKEIKQAHEDEGERDGDTEAYRQYIASLEDAIRQNKIERAEAYIELVGKLTDSLRESIAGALAFKEAEKQRIQEIQHNANSDMEGRPSDEHYRPKFMDKFVNNSFVQFFFSPLATFDQMLRMFGSKSANGEGYLYNRFMRGWVNARQKEIKGVREKFAILDRKAAELFGGKVKNWGDLIRYVGKLPKATVSFWNGGEMKEQELGQELPRKRGCAARCHPL